MKLKILSTFCTIALSLSLNAQELNKDQKLGVLSQIGDSLDKVMEHQNKPGEDVDCYIKQAQVDFNKATFLWSDLAKVNENLVNQTLNNFDDLLQFVKYLDENNDPNSAGSLIYILHAFAELAVDHSAEEIIFDKESMLAILKVVQSEPFNKTINPLVFNILEQVDNIEISKRGKGDYKGETRIKIHNIDGKNISMNINDVMELESEKFSAQFIIKDGAEITFIDGKNTIEGVATLDKKAIKKKNKKIEDIIEGVKAEEISKMDKKSEKRVKKLLKPLKDEDGEDVATFDSYLREHYFSPRSLGGEVSQLKNNYVSLQTTFGTAEKNEEFAKHFAKYITEKKLKKRQEIASEALVDHPQRATLISQMEALRSESLAAIVKEEERKFKIDFEENFNENDQKKIINFVEERSDAKVAAPLYFRVKGFKLGGQADKAKVAGVNLGNVKVPANLQVKEGVLIPGLRLNNGKETNSVFVKGVLSVGGVNLGGVGAARYQPL